ncbi:ribose-phosphate pyrophosphokinase [Fusobacterium nucleatum]|uniref:ribose-phosphate pyrophosphokinase n=1 Tax=Fusobacterium nucleatum TaxID=851 RepID=UPI0030CE0A20
MAKYTENIRLSQPEGSDYYDIEVFNHNSELIDKKIGEMDNSLSTIKEGATREKAGIVKLGTEEGKALEGMMLARLAGAYGYGGDIQDEGVKNPNYIYYDKNTRKMYKCLKQNQDISANVANFIPLDNNSLLERLENLSTFKIQELYSTPAGVKFTIFQYGSLILIAAYTSGTEKLNYGTTYKCNLPYDCYNTATAITGNNGSSGQFSLVNNVLMVNSTDNQIPLKNTFMGQLTTFLK